MLPAVLCRAARTSGFGSFVWQFVLEIVVEEGFRVGSVSRVEAACRAGAVLED